MNRPLRVLHVTETLSLGGAEQNLLSILRTLPGERFENHLAWLFEASQDLFIDEFRPHVASLIPLRAKHATGILMAAKRLAQWIRRHKPDVIHAQLIRSQVVARCAAFLSGRPPMVSTWQSAYYDDVALHEFCGSRLRRALIRFVDRNTGRWDRRFIAVSDYIAHHFEAELHVPPSRIEVVYNAVEPARCSPVGPEVLARTRQELELPEQAQMILSVGRLIPKKGHSDAIAAMPAIVRRLPQAVLLIAGAGPLDATLRAQIASLGLENRVRLLGIRRDVPALFQIADLFLFTTWCEGLSVALVEALANGVPAVVSDIPQNREVADGLASVRFVPIGNKVAMSDAVVQLLGAGPAMRDEAMRSSNQIRQRFAPDVLAPKFAQILEQVAEEASEARQSTRPWVTERSRSSAGSQPG